MAAPTPPEDHESVPSCKATAWQLRGWGFSVKGSVTTHDEQFKGDDLWVARRKAIRAGFCSDEPLCEVTWVGTTKADGADPQLLVWLFQEGRIHKTNALTQ